MRHYHVIKEVVETKELEKVVCDCCGKENISGCGFWMEGETGYDEVSIRHRAVDEGGKVRLLEVDLCPDCFREHVVGALEKVAEGVRYEEA